jgi:hypothetical protein
VGALWERVKGGFFRALAARVYSGFAKRQPQKSIGKIAPTTTSRTLLIGPERDLYCMVEQQRDDKIV